MNFFVETTDLFVNDIKIASRSTTLLRAEQPKDYLREYELPFTPSTRAILEGWGLWSQPKLFSSKMVLNIHYFNVFINERKWEEVRKNLQKKEILETDIFSIKAKISYAPCEETPSFNALGKYPADDVIEYLKERGITTCQFFK